MYYEEKIIDEVLCWRGTPNGVWTQKTAKQLTEMLIEARRSQPAIYPAFVQPPWVTRLLELRQRYIAAGGKLSTLDEINNEVSAGRG